MYVDMKTGEPLVKVSDWEFPGKGLCMAYFKTSRGATISMSKDDVEQPQKRVEAIVNELEEK